MTPAPQLTRAETHRLATPQPVAQAINSGPQNTPAPTTGTVERALPTNSVNEALRDAATMNQAVQNGAAPAFGETKPWVGNAILDALSKYEALTKARNAPAANQTGSGPS